MKIKMKYVQLYLLIYLVFLCQSLRENKLLPYFKVNFFGPREFTLRYLWFEI